MLDRLTSMAVFVKAADLGSFTAAGTTLGLSSQMVGKHVGALEMRLGAPLINRSTRRQSLTEVGRAYYERCRVVLAEVEATDTLLDTLSATPRGRLKVSAPVGFGACRLAPVLTEFLASYPAIELELNLTDRRVGVIEEGYDAVLRLGPIGECELAARELASHDQIACAAPDYLARCGTPAVPGELESHDCLGFVNWSGLPYADWQFVKDGSAYAVQVHSRFQTNDGRTLVAAAVAGQGIILQPEAVVAEAISRGALVPILTDFIAPSRPMYLIYPIRRPIPAKLRAFVDHVAKAFPRT